MRQIERQIDSFVESSILIKILKSSRIYTSRKTGHSDCRKYTSLEKIQHLLGYLNVRFFGITF